jgi:hypothetical protein
LETLTGEWAWEVDAAAQEREALLAASPSVLAAEPSEAHLDAPEVHAGGLVGAMERALAVSAGALLGVGRWGWVGSALAAGWSAASERALPPESAVGHGRHRCRWPPERHVPVCRSVGPCHRPPTLAPPCRLPQ